MILDATWKMLADKKAAEVVVREVVEYQEDTGSCDASFHHFEPKEAQSIAQR